MSNVDKNAEIILVNPTATGGTINLPLTSTLPYRTLTIKHIGSTSLNGITVATQGPDTFEDGTTSYIITRITTFATFYANTSANKWVLVGGTNTFTQTISSLIVNTINGQAYLPISPANLVSTSLLDTTFQSTVRGLATIGYISTSQLVSTTIGLVDHPELQSTIIGLGTVGYISSSQLISTTIGLVDHPELQSTIAGLGTSGYISSSQLLSTTIGLVDQPELQSTIAGLGTSGYISSSQLLSTTIGLVDQPELQSTIMGLGTSGYISSSQLLSTTIGLVDQPELQSTIMGLGTSGYISSSQLLSTTIGLVDQPELQSTIAGLGTSGYISSSQLQSTIGGLGTTGYLSSATGLISTATLDFTLQSTVRGLATTGYISTSQLVSTTIGLVDHLELQSTFIGLGTVGYISTSQLVSTTIGLVDHLELQSTFIGLGTVGYVSSTQLQSTLRGLGTIGYISSVTAATTPAFLSTNAFFTSSLVASTISVTNTFFTNGLIARSTNISSAIISSLIGTTISTQQLITNYLVARSTNLSSVYISSLTAVNGYISSLTTDSLTIGDGNGWIDFGAARAVVFSSVQANTGSLYATTAYIGNTSTLNQIRYWGLFGNYNNTILAEVSTGSAVGAQEFLVFKGSSTSDRIRFQTTGDIRFEPQVAAREFSTATALATPTMILQSNLVGINNAAPTTTLDVIGTIRGNIVSTLALNLSSINGIAYSVASFSNLVSTAFLDTTLRSTIGNLGQVYLSSASNLVSTPFLDTTLLSTINGLGTLNYLSSATLQSTVLGFNANFTTSSLTVSSISFGNTFGFLNLGDVQTDTLSSTSIFTSTINVDGSLFMYDKQLLNYGDLTLSNQSLYINGTVVGGGGGGGITAGNLTSTVEGLGTVNYISGPTIIASTIIALDILGAFNTFSSTLKLLGETDLYEDFPAWNSSNQILGSDPDPAPLRLDVFGSARILKNLYVGSTTTILTTAGVQAEQLSSLHTTASTMTLSSKGPLFASTNTVTSITDVFLNDSYVAQRIPVIPLIISTITTNMLLQPEFLGMHFVLINSDSNYGAPLLVRADAPFVANVPDGWYCYLKQTPDSNYPFNSIEAETDLSNATLPTTDAGMSNYQAPMKFIVSGGLKIPY